MKQFIDWLANLLFGGVKVHVPDILPPAPCGDDEVHYSWVNGPDKFGCPRCSGIAARKRQDEADQRMADRIAEAVVRKMKEA